MHAGNPTTFLAVRGQPRAAFKMGLNHRGGEYIILYVAVQASPLFSCSTRSPTHPTAQPPAHLIQGETCRYCAVYSGRRRNKCISCAPPIPGRASIRREQRRNRVWGGRETPPHHHEEKINDASRANHIVCGSMTPPVSACIGSLSL